MKALYWLFALALLPDAAAAPGPTPDEALYHRAETGDVQAQEAISARMLAGPLMLFGRRRDARDDGTRLLYLAATADHARARQRMAAAAREGKFGVARNARAALCWASRAAAIECAQHTAFDRPAARPTCRQMITRGDQQPWRAADAPAKARLCMANRTLALLIPGGPPSMATEKLIDEYARHGIDYDVTGDTTTAEFEAFRERFNRLMEKEIVARHGPHIFKTIMAAAQR